MSDPARRAAFSVLRAVREDNAYVNLLLPKLLREQRITGRDAAFATELTQGTIRWQGTYDAIIDRLTTGRAVDPPVRDALRLGAHQLLGMRVPDHAAVSTTVALVRREIGHRPAGFVNAVLRRISERELVAWIDEVTTGLSGAADLSVRYSHPQWIVDELGRSLRVVDAAGELPALLAVDNTAPQVTLVARPGLCEPDELPGVPGRFSPWARILTDGGDPGQIAAVRDGRAAVQDEGSQLVAQALAEAHLEGPDARWLDLCAGPGGKAGLLGALAARRGAHLVANEVQPHRAELVRQSLRALPDVEVTAFDGREGPWVPGSFDRILVDAPCSGLGVLRRRPESRWRRQQSDLEKLVPLQRTLLRRAIELTRSGGIVAYATCSPTPAETLDVIESVGPGVAVLERVDRWWPHRDGTDAMFVALLRKR